MPGFFPVDRKLLITSPQDTNSVGLEFHAGNGTFCLIGEYHSEEGFSRQAAQAIDYGLDFYTPRFWRPRTGGGARQGYRA